MVDKMDNALVDAMVLMKEKKLDEEMAEILVAQKVV